MIYSFLAAQSDKIFTMLGALTTVFGGGWFIAAADSTSQLEKYGPLGVVAVGASVLTAYIKRRPDTIKALAEAEAARAKAVAEGEAAKANTYEAATQAMIKRLTDDNKEREARLSRDLDNARSRAEYAEQIQQVDRQAKHAAVEMLHALLQHSRLLEEICREKGVDAPEGPKIDLRPVFALADAKTAALLGERTETTKKSTMRVDLPAVVKLRPPGAIPVASPSSSATPAVPNATIEATTEL